MTRPIHASIFTPAVILALLATWLIWGSTYLAIRFALEDISPYWQMSSRFAVAGAVLFVWLKLRGVPSPSRLEWRNAGIVGGLMLGGGMGCVAVAEQTVSSGLAATLIAALPLVLAFWNWVLNRVLPTRFELMGIVLGLAGVVWLTRGQGLSGTPFGTAMVFTAITCWGLGSLLSRKQTPLAAGGSGAMGFASEMLAGSVVLAVLAIVGGEPLPIVSAIGFKSAAAWVYLVTAGSLVAFSAYMYLLRTVAPSLATTYALVNPIVAVLLGVWLGGEQIAGDELGAIAVILAAVAMMMWAQGRRS